MNTTKRIYKRLVKNAQAVSPIIATLMLVLVAVGAAGAFYVWQSGWQKDVQNKAGGADLQAAMTIGGSTTVYEFAVAAAQYFEAANPNYKINVQKGGSGAGKAAVGTGAIDIGTSSSALTASDKAAYPDLNQDGVKDIGKEMFETHVAYDAVVVIIDSDNTHGLINITEGNLSQIYKCNGGVPGTYTMDVNGDGKIQWNEVPQSTLAFTPKCTGGATEVVKIYDRSDISGTEETFAEKMIDTGKKVLEDAGITANHVESNQVMITTIASSPDGIGFAAYGLAKVTTSGVKMIPFLCSEDNLDGDLFAGEINGQDTANPNVATTFEGYVKASKTDCGKKLFLITVGEPQGDVRVFVDFCLQPENNENICKTGGYIWKY